MITEMPFVLQKSPRIPRMVAHLYEKMPEIEPYRAELVTESYRETGAAAVICAYENTDYSIRAAAELLMDGGAVSE